ncbi:MAG: hypothetical protein PHW62_00435 [Candidatus Ratteibacteria bacterium]|nr:hypothetical protein [Candidatus Ratteibacteria bacterium]
MKTIKFNWRNILLNAAAYMVALILYTLIISGFSKLRTFEWWYLIPIFSPWIAWLIFVFNYKMISIKIGNKIIEVP